MRRADSMLSLCGQFVVVVVDVVAVVEAEAELELGFGFAGAPKGVSALSESSQTSSLMHSLSLVDACVAVDSLRWCSMEEVDEDDDDEDDEDDWAELETD